MSLEQSERQPVIYAQPEGVKALELILSSGAIQNARIPIRNEATFHRNLMVFCRYHFTESSRVDLGKIFDISSERVRQINIHMALILYQATPLEVRDQLPPIPAFLISLEKPVTLKYRQQRSELLGGRTLKISKLLEQGVSFEEIKTSTILDSNERSKIKAKLRDWGFQIKRLNRSPEELERLRDELKREGKTLAETQSVLDQVTTSSLISRYAARENPGIFTLRNLFMDLGIRVHPRYFRQVTEKLEQQGIAVGRYTLKSKGELIGNYWFIAACDLERATSVITTDADLQPLYNKDKRNPLNR